MTEEGTVENIEENIEETIEETNTEESSSNSIYNKDYMVGLETGQRPIGKEDEEYIIQKLDVQQKGKYNNLHQGARTKFLRKAINSSMY